MAYGHAALDAMLMAIVAARNLCGPNVKPTQNSGNLQMLTAAVDGADYQDDAVDSVDLAACGICFSIDVLLGYCTFHYWLSHLCI